MTANPDIVFKQWLGEHLGLILSVVRAYTGAFDQRDDLFQEICLQLWLSIPRYAGRAKASTWIYRVALNTALVWNRKEGRRRRRSTLMPMVKPLPSDGSDESEEIVERLYEAIRKLPKTDASIVLMHLDGLSYAEMAEILGISEGHIGVKLNRVKKKLACLLKGFADDL